MANKTELNLHCQKHKIPTATYTTEETSKGEYTSVVTCGTLKFASRGSHLGKKAAEDSAASLALEYFKKNSSPKKPVNKTDDELSLVEEINHLEIDPVSGQTSLPQHPMYQAFDNMRNVGKPFSAVRLPASLQERERAWSELKEYAQLHGLPEPQQKLAFQNDKVSAGTLTVGPHVFQLQEEEMNLSFDEVKHRLTLKAMQSLRRADASPPLANSGVHQHSQSSSTQQQQQQQLQQQHHNDQAADKQAVCCPTIPAPTHELIAKSYIQYPRSTMSLPAQSSQQQEQLLPPSVFSGPSSLPERPTKDVQQQEWPQPPQVTHPSTSTFSTQSPSSTSLVEQNCRQILNEFCQKARLTLPVYTVLSPIDTVGYVALVKVDGNSFQSPVAANKKRAQNQAAAAALQGLGISFDRQCQGGMNSAQPAMTPGSPSQSITTSALQMVGKGAPTSEQQSQLGGEKQE